MWRWWRWWVKKISFPSLNKFKSLQYDFITHFQFGILIIFGHSFCCFVVDSASAWIIIIWCIKGKEMQKKIWFNVWLLRLLLLLYFSASLNLVLAIYRMICVRCKNSNIITIYWLIIGTFLDDVPVPLHCHWIYDYWIQNRVACVCSCARMSIKQVRKMTQKVWNVPISWIFMWQLRHSTLFTTVMCKRFHSHFSHSHSIYNNNIIIRHIIIAMSPPFPSIERKNDFFPLLKETKWRRSANNEIADLIFKRLMILKLILFLWLNWHSQILTS